MVISLIRYQGKYFRSPVNFSLSRLGLFVLVSGQWSFVCRNQSGQRVTAPARCDLFSTSLPLPPRFFPSLPPRALPGDITTAPGMQLGGDPAPTLAAPGLFLLFFPSVLGPFCWFIQGSDAGFQGCRVLVTMVLSAEGLVSLQNHGPCMPVSSRMRMQDTDLWWHVQCGIWKDCGHQGHGDQCRLNLHTQCLQTISEVNPNRACKTTQLPCSKLHCHMTSLQLEGKGDREWCRGAKSQKNFFGYYFGKEVLSVFHGCWKQERAFICKSICSKCRRGLIGTDLRKSVCLSY